MLWCAQRPKGNNDFVRTFRPYTRAQPLNFAKSFGFRYFPPLNRKSKRVVDFLRTALRKLNQDWPRSVNLRTPLWSRLTMFCHPSIPILMHHMCCGAPSGLKVIMTSSVPLGLIPGAQPLNFAKSFRVPIFPAIEQKSIFQVLSYTEYLCGTKTEWLVKSRKINITPYQWLTNELSISWEQLWESLTKIDQDPSTFEHRFDHV